MRKNWDEFVGIAAKSLLPDPSAIQEKHSVPNQEQLVWYRGVEIPKWLACDLMQERAAILEYQAGFTRSEAEAIVRGNK